MMTVFRYEAFANGTAVAIDLKFEAASWWQWCRLVRIGKFSDRYRA
jgi:hypothetical protein